ncbi:Cys-tRNA(Pro) deacylase, prolyl-tRNA editing enzyme YbaK/EbsC [Peptoniphilus asaccharolyticus DSM 20463]|uniref:Cys-tRNA(Pro) deacylase, prolyl-tRNA editing enzyme YbaK/EbsC n=1 Tax=Peptoniphilus asaccharolyticus DSM 20463 TaxID=573058 RepID=A0A1W1VD35_PEPAS|nr:YbaK/EbsC family protein [Peptoniphilus asaccharolyticus]MBL7574580.1 YbaK/EbsC family protein [Peptoniphilus asaccharolyticus]SMB91288.1 Cys-tRNA(Pro) deacylase, prolyl-tRNA editing enzyme YbaK/EbsC [Peptoniphilus asaccharolyticus DSM 20463]
MSVESVREVFKKDDLEDLVLHSDVISDTVENAASLLGCEPKQIAKTMSFVIGDETVLIVTSGDAKIDNPKYKAKFNSKAKMASFEDVERLTGHSPGGICPFGLKDNVKVYLDESLKRFDIVYTGGGDSYNTVKVNLEQLEKYSNYIEWIDVCKNWQE